MLVKLHSFRLFSLFPYSASFYLISQLLSSFVYSCYLFNRLYISIHLTTLPSSPSVLNPSTLYLYSHYLLFLSLCSPCVCRPFYPFIKYLYLHLYLSNSLIRLIYLFSCYFTRLLTSSFVLLLSTL